MIETEEQKLTVGGVEYTEAELAEALKKSKIRPTIASTLADVPAGHMRLATFWLKTTKLGSNVQMKDVTPAEALYLTSAFSPEAGGNPISDLQETGTVERTTEDERDRLLARYGARINEVFPGAIPQMPETFQRAIKLGMATKLRAAALVEVDITKNM